VRLLEVLRGNEKSWLGCRGIYLYLSEDVRLAYGAGVGNEAGAGEVQRSRGQGSAKASECEVGTEVTSHLRRGGRGWGTSAGRDWLVRRAFLFVIPSEVEGSPRSDGLNLARCFLRDVPLAHRGRPHRSVGEGAARACCHSRGAAEESRIRMRNLTQVSRFLSVRRNRKRPRGAARPLSVVEPAQGVTSAISSHLINPAGTAAATSNNAHPTIN
jgi:hypothetical protein